MSKIPGEFKVVEGSILKFRSFDDKDRKPAWWAIAADTHKIPDVQFFIGGGEEYDEGEGISTDEVLDHWEVVPLDKLPNYVCAALAKWRLTGEIDAS